MKRLLAAAFVASFGLVGCDKGTPGGPGATGSGTNRGTGTNATNATNDRAANAGVVTADNTFTLDVANFGINIKQGEAKNESIAIRRGTNFDQDVALKFENLPKGVTIDPASPTIKKGDKDAKFSVKAADDAALGDAKVKVVGHPGTGADATNEFTLTVKQK